MAYSHPSLFRVGGTDSQAPSIWTYTTTDSAADINTADYFLLAIADLTAGDLIFATTSTGTTTVAALYYVLTNTGTAIDVNDGTVLANTDSD